MSVSRFAPGDLVRMKGAGPLMTVLETAPPKDDRPARVRCAWFEGNEVRGWGELHDGAFPEAVLVLKGGA